jgi:GrpB-like predicted nucleotidyltransferase (UPF0157 family)
LKERPASDHDARCDNRRVDAQERDAYLGKVLIGGCEKREIVIVDYDSGWPARYELERDRVRRALSVSALRIEHIGSTAVPGLAAKLIIDLLVTMADPDDETVTVAALGAAGYELRVREQGIGCSARPSGTSTCTSGEIRIRPGAGRSAPRVSWICGTWVGTRDIYLQRVRMYDRAVYAVLNRIRLREPLDDAALSVAQRDLDVQAAQVEGLSAIQILQTDEGDLVVLVFGDDEAALERTREQIGNTFMREHVIPHADGPPERTITKVILSYQRAPIA